jgi:hypothetical protein
MAFAPTTPVTGAAQTGLTSPTYTLASSQAPDVNAKQYAVTALGGTQTGVTTHSASAPFTVAMFVPKQFKALGKPHPVTGLIANVENNTYKVITRKAATPLAGQPTKNINITTVIDVPAGIDVNDKPNLAAALSLHIGTLTQVPTGVGDTVVSGTL